MANSLVSTNVVSNTLKLMQDGGEARIEDPRRVRVSPKIPNQPLLIHDERLVVFADVHAQADRKINEPRTGLTTRLLDHEGTE